MMFPSASFPPLGSTFISQNFNGKLTENKIFQSIIQFLRTTDEQKRKSPMENITNDRVALIRAAKYICMKQCGRCPMVIEGFSCPDACSLETLPWQCWLEFFKKAGPEAEITPQA